MKIKKSRIQQCFVLDGIRKAQHTTFLDSICVHVYGSYIQESAAERLVMIQQE